MRDLRQRPTESFRMGRPRSTVEGETSNERITEIERALTEHDRQIRKADIEPRPPW